MIRVVACGDALYSSRNLARRLDHRYVETLRSADAAFANAESNAWHLSTPLAMKYRAMFNQMFWWYVPLDVRPPS